MTPARPLAAAVLALVVLSWVGLLAPSTVRAADVTDDQALAALDQARALVEDSVSLYADGQADAAFQAARSAYLDHFEYVEIPLRVRDDALTLELEEDFARLRTAIEDGAPLDEVRLLAATTQRGLDRVERTLASPGLAAPILAAVSAFTILFREGLEAVLVVASVLGYLEASRHGAYKGAVLRGVVAALLTSLLAFALISAVLNLAPVYRELIEAVMAVAAVALLFYVSFWMVARLDQRRWMEFVKARVWAAAATGSTVALFWLGFTIVFREGLETALFYQALFSFAQGLELYVALGVAVAVVVLAIAAWMILRMGRRIPVKRFLQVAVTMIMVLSVAFVGNAIRALQQSALVPVTYLDDAPRLPIFLADLTGYHPTLQTIVGQIALALVYVAGAFWVFVIVPRRVAAAARPVEPLRATGPDATG